MSHLWTGSIRALCHQLEANKRAAVGTFRTDCAFIQELILISCEPHELETFVAATDLR